MERQTMILILCTGGEKKEEIRLLLKIRGVGRGPGQVGPKGKS